MEYVKLQKNIREVSKGERCYNRIQWKSLVLESAGGDDHQFLRLTQDCSLTEHILEPTRGWNVLDLTLSSQTELDDNVKVHEHFGSSENTYKKQWRRNFSKGKCKEKKNICSKYRLE